MTIPTAQPTPPDAEDQPGVVPVTPAAAGPAAGQPAPVIPPPPAGAPNLAADAVPAAPAPATVTPVTAVAAAAPAPVAPAPAAAAPAVDMDALAAAVSAALLPTLLAQVKSIAQVPQLATGQTPAPATRVAWGDPTATLTAGQVVSHGYYSHVDGFDVIRYGLVVDVQEIVMNAATGETAKHYVVGWLTDNSDALPASELRAV
jgi:hypothetical protein